MRKPALLFGISLCLAPAVRAQNPMFIINGVRLERVGADSFGKYLYSPEFVMAHQEAIGLTDGQRTAIQDAVKEIQSKTIVDTQFKLASATERLTQSLARPSVDEAAVLQQVDETLALEREVKRAQMTLLVRIKNQLTAQQQKLLDKLRSP